MEDIEDFSDDRLKSSCFHCNDQLRAGLASRDHVPTRALLCHPEPDNLPEVLSCHHCNQSFSLDEEYLACLLSATLSDSVSADDQRIATAAKVFKAGGRLKRRIARARSIGADGTGVWSADVTRVARVLVKNARGHARFELGEPPPFIEPQVSFGPLSSLTPQQLAAFERRGLPTVWPEVGCRMMERLVSGVDFAGGWVVVQPNSYRYRVEWTPVIVSIVLHEYLAATVAWRDD